jgi:hypothetical protein
MVTQAVREEALMAEFDIAKLKLVPGDVLVVRSARVLSPEQVQRVRDNIRKATPEGVNVLIIDNTFELSVLTRGEIEKLPE